MCPLLMKLVSVMQDFTLAGHERRNHSDFSMELYWVSLCPCLLVGLISSWSVWILVCGSSNFMVFFRWFQVCGWCSLGGWRTIVCADLFGADVWEVYLHYWMVDTPLGADLRFGDPPLKLIGLFRLVDLVLVDNLSTPLIEDRWLQHASSTTTIAHRRQLTDYDRLSLCLPIDYDYCTSQTATTSFVIERNKKASQAFSTLYISLYIIVT